MERHPLPEKPKQPRAALLPSMAGNLQAAVSVLVGVCMHARARLHLHTHACTHTPPCTHTLLACAATLVTRVTGQARWSLLLLAGEPALPMAERRGWKEVTPGGGFSSDGDTVSSACSRDRAPLEAHLPHSRMGLSPAPATSGRPERRPRSPLQRRQRYQGGWRFLSRLPGGTSQKGSCWDAKKESSKRDTWPGVGGGPKVSRCHYRPLFQNSIKFNYKAFLGKSRMFHVFWCCERSNEQCVTHFDLNRVARADTPRRPSSLDGHGSGLLR